MTSLESFSPDLFETFDVQLKTQDASGEITIHGVRTKASNTSSSRPPLLLLHGYPQTHHIWHKIAPLLAPHYELVIPDLRGYGESSKPNLSDDTEHDVYSKRAMAQDQISLMNHFGFDKFYFVGHDRGARVGHRLALDHRERVEKIVLLDIAPTLAMYENTTTEFAQLYWHWFFLIQPSPLPEELLFNASQSYLRWFNFRGFPESAFQTPAFKSYTVQFTSYDAVHATTEDYRASAPGGIDLRRDAEDLKAGKKIKAPMLVLYGEKGVIARCFDAGKEWEKVSEREVVAKAVPTGHYIPEEMDPADLTKEIRDFFDLSN